MIKKLIIFMLCILTATSISGCTGRKDQSAKTVGIVMPTKALERWSRDGDYLKSLFEEEGYSVELRFSEDLLRQVSDIQVLIADDVDILIVAPIDGAALSRTLEDASIKKNSGHFLRYADIKF